jgi:hypothetical protein
VIEILGQLGVLKLYPLLEEPALYKTALCTFYEQGLCTKGETCTYAHGIEELQAGATLLLTPGKSENH